jgi:hypothetical protein
VHDGWREWRRRRGLMKNEQDVGKDEKRKRMREGMFHLKNEWRS